MAYKLVILDEAKREFRQIVDYLTNVLQSPQAARHFMDEFDHQIELIAHDPRLFGLSRLPELAAHGYRTAFVNNYLVLYTVRDDMIAVAHIVHQTQDYARLLR